MENFTHAAADLYIPDALEASAALARTTHLGVGAHQDDLEFMALHGILECFEHGDSWFGAITCTDGASSSRTAGYADVCDSEMKRIRGMEQRTAGLIGQYGFVAQLGHPSRVAKVAGERRPMVDDLHALLRKARPRVIYTHNPFDKHSTHVGVLLALLEAIDGLEFHERPEQLIGCEVWRSLDWLPDEHKLLLDCSSHSQLSEALARVFDSQISGGKRYDRAILGRRWANATFSESHAADAASEISIAIDLTGLIGNKSGLPVLVNELLDNFRSSVTDTLRDLAHQ